MDQACVILAEDSVLSTVFSAKEPDKHKIKSRVKVVMEPGKRNAIIAMGMEFVLIVMVMEFLKS